MKRQLSSFDSSVCWSTNTMTHKHFFTLPFFVNNHFQYSSSVTQKFTMPRHLVHEDDLISLRKVVFHEEMVDGPPRVLQTLARHKTVFVTQYRINIDHIARPFGVPPIVIPPIDWAVPVSELTAKLSGIYPRVNTLGFGE